MAITYPIQESDRFTIYDTATQAPLKDGGGKDLTNQKWGSLDSSKMIQGLAENIKWLIEVRASQPAYDQATQKLKRAGTIYDVASETATTNSFEVSDLTQAEIDAKTPANFETSQGIKLKVDLQSQAAFTSMSLLVNEAAMGDAEEVKVQDVYGVAHTLTVLEYKTEILSYGFFCYNLFHAVPETVDSDFI